MSRELIDPSTLTFATGDVVHDAHDRPWTASAPPEFPVTYWARDDDAAEIITSDLLQSAYAPISRDVA